MNSFYKNLKQILIIMLKKFFPYKFYRHNPYFSFIFNINLAFFLHFIYLLFANLLNVFLKIKKNRITRFFLLNGFYKKILGDKDSLYVLFKYLDAYLKDKRNISLPVLCNLKNFTYIKNFKPVDSSKHLYSIPNSLINLVDNYLRKDKDFDNLIKFYFKSNYYICNVRIWRYLANVRKNLSTVVGAHYDTFPHKSLKIMVYKGFFSKKSGALDVVNQKTNEVIYSVKGRDPIILLDTNHLFHQAQFPVKDRDTIEITLLPSIKIKKALHAGFAAGYPINPFKNCESKKILF